MRPDGAIPTPLSFSLTHTHAYFPQDVSALLDSYSYSSREGKTLWIKIPIYKDFVLVPSRSYLLVIHEEACPEAQSLTEICLLLGGGWTNQKPSLRLAGTEQFIDTSLLGFVASFAILWAKSVKKHTDNIYFNTTIGWIRKNYPRRLCS